MSSFHLTTLLTKTTAPQNDIALSYRKVRGLYYPAVVFAATIRILLIVYYDYTNRIGELNLKYDILSYIEDTK